MANKPKNQENNVSLKKNVKDKKRVCVRVKRRRIASTERVEQNILDEGSFDFVAYTIGCGEDCSPWRGVAAYQTVSVEDGEMSEIRSKFLRDVTSNYLHMLAIMSAVNSVPEGVKVLVYSQSVYAVNVLSGKWKARKHQNLISNYTKIAEKREVSLEWKPFYQMGEFKDLKKNIEAMPEMKGVAIKVRHRHEMLK